MRLHADERIQGHLKFLYGETDGEHVWPLLQTRLVKFAQRHPQLQDQVKGSMQVLTEKDAILITYGDQFQQPGQPPLSMLNAFLLEHLQGAINGIHILPFFPYSSDDGFSVIDYREVDPELGTWEDIRDLGENFRLMFDAVINHISRESRWFQAFLRGEDPYRDYFITIDPSVDLSMVVRPRALPLLTQVETVEGTRHVWTTFSDDQIDLDYSNPQVLLEIVDLLLFYIEEGAEIIRLDAIAYLWKKVGTPSIHLPETHHVVKLFRAVLDAVAPEAILITETNVPHEENISYFGERLSTGSDPERGDEAQMVYQFPLAPLVLHTFHTANASTLTEWAAGLETPYPSPTFFNFIASHDGIGVRPAEGLLSASEIEDLVERTKKHGGQVSYKTNKDGTRSVYELNITLYDVINDPDNPEETIDVRRFLASQVIMLSLAGVPGIYVHSLFGSRNCHACLEQTGRARSINREKFQRSEIESKLRNFTSTASQVFEAYTQLLRLRQGHPAFHPNAGQKIHQLEDSIFSLTRTSLDGGESILCLINVTPEVQLLEVSLDEIGLPRATQMGDLISGEKPQIQDGVLRLELDAYQSGWFTEHD